MDRILPVIVGNYRIFPPIVLKFMNFWVAKVNGNNGTFYGSIKI